jgi:hypothetical protein
MTKDGPSKLQLFGDFEHVFTKFKTEDGGRQIELLC